MPTSPITFEMFRDEMLGAGYEEVLERPWAPGTVVPVHTHPFEADALVVQGEMWLTEQGGPARRLVPGDRFHLPAHEPHEERYAHEMGADGVTLCDTTGMAYPTQVARLTQAVRERFGQTELTLHFHNTRGMGLANVLAGIAAGADRFDASFGGIGGCPYAPGADRPRHPQSAGQGRAPPGPACAAGRLCPDPRPCRVALNRAETPKHNEETTRPVLT